MSNMSNLVETIQSLKPSQVVRNEVVKQQFINVYNAIWREGGEQVYEREALNFQKVLRDKKELKDCTPLSFFFAFIDLAVQGLSLEPGARAMAYLLPRSFKITTPEGHEVWEKRCNLSISGFGEIYLRQRAGQIRYADNPVIVYDGDHFEFGEENGHKFVNYRMNQQNRTNKIVGCFMKITRIDNSIDYAVMVEADWKRLAVYSGKNNAYWDKSLNRRVEKPNELYTSVNGGIDPGFLAAKLIKHAFRSYPKLQIGKGSVLESDVVEQQEFDPYGGMTQTEGEPGTMTHDARADEQQQQSFAEEKDTSSGVTVDTGDDGDDVF